MSAKKIVSRSFEIKISELKVGDRLQIGDTVSARVTEVWPIDNSRTERVDSYGIRVRAYFYTLTISAQQYVNVNRQVEI